MDQSRPQLRDLFPHVDLWKQHLLWLHCDWHPSCSFGRMALPDDDELALPENLSIVWCMYHQ